MDGLQFFDPKQDFTVVLKTLPHWAQAGTLCFITWRTADSLPLAVQRELTAERDEILRQFGLDPTANWKDQLAKLPAVERGCAQWALFAAWDERLDGGAGACALARPKLSAIVMESLLHFDGARYVVTDAVVMPNHVHLLAAFRDEDSLLAQCISWKRFTGRRIAAVLRGEAEGSSGFGETGPRGAASPKQQNPHLEEMQRRRTKAKRREQFWQREQFDHLVRSPEQFEHYRRYIWENPEKARLTPGTFRHYSKALS